MKKHDFKKLMLSATAGLLAVSSSALADEDHHKNADPSCGQHHECNDGLKLAAHCGGKGGCGGNKPSSYQKPSYIADDEEEETQQKKQSDEDNMNMNNTNTNPKYPRNNSSTQTKLS